MAPSSKYSSVNPPYIKPAGTVENRRLECRSGQLSVLFRRKKDQAGVISLLKWEKDLSTSLYHPLGLRYVPPAKISIYQKIGVYIPFSIIHWDWICSASKNLSIRKSRSLNLSIIHWDWICSASKRSVYQKVEVFIPLYHPLGLGYVPPARIKIKVYIPLSNHPLGLDMFRQK